MALCMGLLPVAPAWAQSLVISEFMAVNTNSIQDEDDAYEDWIEIQNTGTGTVDLAGWHLTDESSNLDKWTFPSTNIAPGGFVIVFASNKDRATPGDELHTNFRLSGEGEYLALVQPNGVTVESSYDPYPPQVANVSFGVAPGTVTNELVSTNANCVFYVPSDDSLGYDWIEQFFDNSAWATGRVGVGFDQFTNTPPDYTPDIRANVETNMYGINGTIYIRIPFVLNNPSALQSLQLDMKFDDGFVAFINGEEVVSVNDRDINTWNTRASAVHDALAFEPFLISDVDEFLELGTNVLAIHGMNQQTTSSDLLMLPRLSGIESATLENGHLRYFQVPTPGAINGSGTADLGPSFLSVSHTPESPADNEDLVVSARIIGSTAPVSTATLHYVVMFTNTTSTAMYDDGLHGDQGAGDGIFAATIPNTSFTTGQMIRYYLTAVATNGITNRWPLAEDSIQYLGTVCQNPSVTSSLRTFQWFVQNPLWHAKTNGGNNLNWTNGWVYFEGRFYDEVRMRVRGNSSSGWLKPHFKFEFPDGHHFVWNENEEAVEEFNLQSTYSDKAYVRQILGMETYRNAGVPYSETFPVRVQQNGSFYSTAVWLEQPGEDYLQRQGLDDEGALYKMFNQMTSSSSGVEKKTRKDEDNSDLLHLVNGVSTTNSATTRRRYLFDNVDIPAAINYVAATTIMHDNDHVAKNYYVYRDTPGDGEWTFLPWDKDLTFGRNYMLTGGGVLSDVLWANADAPIATNLLRSPSHPLFGDSDHQKNDGPWNRFIDALHDDTFVRQMYLRRLRTLMDQLLQPNGAPTNLLYEARIASLYTQMVSDVVLDRAKWGNPYGSNQTIEAAMALLTNAYLNVRRTHLYVTHSGTNGAKIPAALAFSPSIHFGTIEFASTSSNQSREYVELINTNAFAVELSGWSLSNAVRFTFAPGTVIAAQSNLYVSPNLPAFRARPTSPKSNESRFVVGPYSGNLSTRGETIALHDSAGLLVSSATFTGTPSAFQNNLRVTEIMFHPDPAASGSWDGEEYEFIELKNVGSSNLNLAGVSFTSGISYTFTNLTLGAGQLVVLVRNHLAFASRYDTNGILVAGVFTGGLNNASDDLRLADPQGEEILDFPYFDTWYPETDGHGRSLHIINANVDYTAWGSATSWHASVTYRGSPGRDEPTLPIGSVVISEALTHSDNQLDWVELLNTTTNSIDISGWLLSDSGQRLRKFQIPAGTVLSGGTYRVFDESDFNNLTNPPAIVPFAFSELGEEVHLSSATNGTPTAYHEMYVFGAQDQNVTFGRHINSEGREMFVATASPTPGSNNAPPRVGPFVLQEILYDPLSNAFEFIEIRNISNTTVTLYDVLRPTNRWKLAGAVDFTFPTNRQLGAGGQALVVPTDPSVFRAMYNIPAAIPIYGPYTGSLDNAGETVMLMRPGIPEAGGFVPYVLYDQVQYDDASPWPTNNPQDGWSIERVTATAFGDDPTNWRTANFMGSPGTITQLDDDQDGLPDNWEVVYFNATGATNATPGADPDGDGYNNASEYIYGSSATSAVSAGAITITNSDGTARIRFQTFEASGPGYYGQARRYEVSTSSNILDAVWYPLPGFENLAGTNGFTEFTNSLPIDLEFFRVRAWME